MWFHIYFTITIYINRPGDVLTALHCPAPITHATQPRGQATMIQMHTDHTWSPMPRGGGAREAAYGALARRTGEDRPKKIRRKCRARSDAGWDSCSREKVTDTQSNGHSRDGRPDGVEETLLGRQQQDPSPPSTKSTDIHREHIQRAYTESPHRAHREDAQSTHRESS